MSKIILTEDEKRVIETLRDDMFTVEFVQKWVNRNVFLPYDPPGEEIYTAASKGFLRAVRRIVKNTNNLKSEA